MVSILGVLVGGDAAGWDRCAGQATEIFRGVVYGCEKLAMTAEGGGLVHWVRVDLTAPGIKLYVTPLDAKAVSEGWQYRLRWIRDVATSEQLAVVINGTMFVANSHWLMPMAGDFARGVETVLADHVVSHVWEHTYLLWFDDQLNPHLRRATITPADLAMAKWGIGGQAVWLHDGKVWPGSDRRPDARTAIAVDERQKRLFLALAEWISPRRLLDMLAKLGAKEGMLLDGGHSSAMAIGQGASNVPAGTVFGGWRAVPTYFGIKAEPVALSGEAQLN
jgi:hypothetical protein